MTKKLVFVIALILPYIFVGLFFPVVAQELESSNYTIIDPTNDSGGGSTESTTYGLLSSTGTLGDTITSPSYTSNSGFPNGIEANVPTLICAETDTNSGNTNCNDFPNANGAIGECGTPGCYTTAKIELDPSGNPVDTLYLVVVEDTTNAVTYYLQSDHTIDTTYDINDYQDLCSIQGIDTRAESECTNNTELGWDEALQSMNVYGLSPQTDYDFSARALNGDFTEGITGPTQSATTTAITFSFDLDIGPTTAANTNAPHAIDFGILGSVTPTVATDLVWFDVSGNARDGLSVFVRDANNGLSNGTDTIPSSSEDLDVDPGGDGGFGIRVDSLTQTSLGPLSADPVYDVAANNVGAVSTADALLFSSSLGTGTYGAVTDGRVGVQLIGLSTSITQGGVFSDTLTFTLVPNL